MHILFMSLEIVFQKAFLDTDIVPAVVWTPDGQLISCGDDKLVYRWSADGEKLGKITTLNVFVTWMSWFPATGKQV